jgi:hypothetical protein
MPKLVRIDSVYWVSKNKGKVPNHAIMKCSSTTTIYN